MQNAVVRHRLPSLLGCLLTASALAHGAPAAAVNGVPCLALSSDQEVKAPKPLEPSGMVWDGANKLYIVSDNGQIVSIPVQSTTAANWTVLFEGPAQEKKAKNKKQSKKEKEEEKLEKTREKKSYDFESLARVPARDGFLYVGLEGDDCEKCDSSRILEFDLNTQAFTGKQWVLGGKGMEAMTFIPDAKVDPQGFRGYFLIARQSSSQAHRFNLQWNSGEVAEDKKTVPAFTPRLKSHTSDFQYDPSTSTLYVAYDDDGAYGEHDAGKQRVDQYTLADGAFGNHKTTKLPYSRGVEGVAYATLNSRPVLYIGIDMSNKQRQPGPAVNRVDLYAPWPNPESCSPRH